VARFSPLRLSHRNLEAMPGAESSLGEQTVRPDLVLLTAVAALLLLGLDMVYSASYVIAHNSPQYQSDTYFLTRQMIWAALGLFAMLITMRIDYRHWRRLSVPLMVISLLALLAVLVPKVGHSAYGAQRWLSLGPLPPVQPSEFAKLALLLYLSDWLSRRRDRLGELSQGTLPFALSVGAVCALVMLQPDMGSTIVILVASLSLFFLAGCDLRHFLGGLAGGGAIIALLIVTVGYRSDRLAAYLDPSSDPTGVGWHIIQSSIALGSGGLFGLGLGASRQKFYYLPGAHTDAIYAVIGEELGLLGTLSVLALFFILLYRGLRITQRAPDSYGALLAAGITFWIVLQALINIAVVTATVPFTGITLPFVSSGGSSLLVSLVAVGILLSISRHQMATRSTENRNRGAEPITA